MHHSAISQCKWLRMRVQKCQRLCHSRLTLTSADVGQRWGRVSYMPHVSTQASLPARLQSHVVSHSDGRLPSICAHIVASVSHTCSREGDHQQANTAQQASLWENTWLMRQKADVSIRKRNHIFLFLFPFVFLNQRFPDVSALRPKSEIWCLPRTRT